MMTNTATAMALSPPLSPAWAIDAAAANVSARFFGLTPDSSDAEAERLAGGEAVDGAHPLRHLGLLARLRAAPATA